MFEVASEQEHLDGANYVVHIGYKSLCAETVQEVWQLIGSRQFGQSYMVSSPIGLDVSEFIPF